MENGWVKLYRKIEQNDFLMMDNNAFLTFTKLLLFADKKTGSYRSGQRALAKKFNLPYSTTYKALKRLQENNLIIIENRVKYSKIYITNWTVYQSNREIDHVLEHNAVQIGKQPKEQKKQGKITKKEAVGEAHGKRTGSAREDYNKNEEIRLNNKLTDVSLLRTHKDQVSKLYYEAIKSLDLPVTNHNTIRAKINELAANPEQQRIINYLTFIRDQFATTEWAYKPNLNNALDIFTKRQTIKNTFEKAIKDQTSGKALSV